MIGTCPRSVYGALCDPIFYFDVRRAVCRRCGGDMSVDWRPGVWRAHRYNDRVTFWREVDPQPGSRVIIDDLGSSQAGTLPWVVLQDEHGQWHVIEEAREADRDLAALPDSGG